MSELEHGKQYTYNKHKCRCELCTKAVMTYWNAYKKGARLHKPKECGTITMYNCGCRCELCRKVKSDNNRKNHMLRKLKKAMWNGECVK